MCKDIMYPEEMRGMWCERVCKLGGAYGVKEVGWEVEEGGYFMLEDGWYEDANILGVFGYAVSE